MIASAKAAWLELEIVMAFEENQDRLNERMHVCIGILAAMDCGAQVFAAAQAADSPAEARAALQRLHLTLKDDARAIIGIRSDVYQLDETQARLVLDLRLCRYIRSERASVVAEITDLVSRLRIGQ